MVKANLKYTKKNNNNNPVMRSKSLSNEKKKPTHKKQQNKTKLTKKTKKQSKHKNKIKMQLQQQQRHQCIIHGIRESYKTWHFHWTISQKGLSLRYVSKLTHRTRKEGGGGRLAESSISL